MADYRCPAHDVVFQAETDQTKPGTPGKNHRLDDRGISCHPDCPIGKKVFANKPVAAQTSNVAQSGTRRIG